MSNWLKWLWYHRNYIIIIVTPLALLPLPLVVPTPVSVCVCAWIQPLNNRGVGVV